jgi:hypothetical protein
MNDPDGTHWKTEDVLFAGLNGGPSVRDWFGYIPSFHDATLDRLELVDRNAALVIRCFRVTNEVDPSGHYVLDRRAVVTIHLAEVSGLSLVGDSSSIISELGIRRVEGAPPRFDNCGGPRRGDLEVRLESSYGLEGSIFARQIRLVLGPARGRTSALGRSRK